MFIDMGNKFQLLTLDMIDNQQERRAGEQIKPGTPAPALLSESFSTPNQKHSEFIGILHLVEFGGYFFLIRGAIS